MHATFSVGLLAGIILASAVVLGSVYTSPPTQQAAGPLDTSAGQAKTTTATSTSASTEGQVPALTSINGILSTSSTTSSTGGQGANTSSPPGAYSLRSTTSTLPSPRISALLSQPNEVPILILPLIAALLLGIALYRVSARKD